MRVRLVVGAGLAVVVALAIALFIADRRSGSETENYIHSLDRGRHARPPGWPLSSATPSDRWAEAMAGSAAMGSAASSAAEPGSTSERLKNTYVMSDAFHCLASQPIQPIAGRPTTVPRETGAANSDRSADSPSWADVAISFVRNVACPFDGSDKTRRCMVEVFMSDNCANADFNPMDHKIRYSYQFLKDQTGSAGPESKQGASLFLGIMAHEYGHYLDWASQGEYVRTFLANSSEIAAYLDAAPTHAAGTFDPARQVAELWADSVAGCMLSLTDMTSDQYDYFLCGAAATDNYPPSSVRMVALRDGWKRCAPERAVPELPDCQTRRPN
jgi:hypothetical protein